MKLSGAVLTKPGITRRQTRKRSARGCRRSKGTTPNDRSAIGGLVSWEPFDFGLRSANVAAASAARAQSEATVKRTQFEVAVAAVDAYLTVVGPQETVRAAQAGVDRAEVVLKTITAQVNTQLRPGADQSRAEAEVAASRTQLIQAQQAVDVSRATLSQFVGAEPSHLAVVAGRLAQLPPEEPRLR